MSEALGLVRRLLDGETVNHQGDAFALETALIRPVPRPPVPVVVGGRSPAALRRAGRLGDGWLGVFVDPLRFGESIERVAEVGADVGRHDVAWQHGVLAWCGFAESREAARPALAMAMEDLYQLPFERFERYAPYGTADDVAEALLPYVEQGASTVLLAAVAAIPKSCSQERRRSGRCSDEDDPQLDAIGNGKRYLLRRERGWVLRL